MSCLQPLFDTRDPIFDVLIEFSNLPVGFEHWLRDSLSFRGKFISLSKLNSSEMSHLFKR